MAEDLEKTPRDITIVEDDFEVEMINETKNKITLNGVYSPLSQEQLMFILQKTPQKHIQKRKGKGGGEFDYVSGVFVKKVLNHVFAWNWDFKILSREILKSEVIVHGQLTVRIREQGQQEIQTIVKEQFGTKDIAFFGTSHTRKGEPVSIGNDLKAAATDALKKCASELGIASDVFGKNEFKDIVGEIKAEDKKNEYSLVAMKTQILNAKTVAEVEKVWSTLTDSQKAKLKQTKREKLAEFDGK